MKAFDKFLQNQRFKQTNDYVFSNCTLIDIGCNQGELFLYHNKKKLSGVGVDPLFQNNLTHQLPNTEFLISGFPTRKLSGRKFDIITALAVLEHIPENNLPDFAEACFKLLNPGGKLIVTVPSPMVDYILYVLKFIGLVSTLSVEQHYGFKPKDTAPLFCNVGFDIKLHKKFELGMNNLFVFEK